MVSADLVKWLRTIGLENYRELFAENKIDLDVLPSLTDSDLRQIAIPIGDRKRLIRAIAALEHHENDAPSPEGAQPLPALVGDQNLPLTDRSEQRQLTLMFADLVGSTAMAEQFDLEQYHALLARFLDVSASIVRDHDGFIAQYQGDCILAYFGFPNPLEDDAVEAASAGLEIVKAVAEIRAVDGRSLGARVGIATGVVLIGNLLKDKVAGPSPVMGETPNLASRLQSQAEPGTVVVNDSARDLLGRSFDCADLGTRQLKGFSDPVRIWKVIKKNTIPSRFEGRRRGALTPFVNRDEEIVLLMRRWRRVRTGSGQAVLVRGEPGIGKSRIAQLMVERTADDGPTCLYYQCSPIHTGSAFRPIIAQLEFAAGIRTSDSAEQKLDKLEAIVHAPSGQERTTYAVLARLLSIPTEGRYGENELSAAQFKETVRDILFAQMTALCERGPVLITVEDLQWIDPTTEDFLADVVGRLAALPILLICTSRPEYDAGWISRPHAALLNLRRLDDKYSAALVESVSEGRLLPDQITSTIFAKTDGVPLFLEELTKSVLESGDLRLEDGAYRLGDQIDTLTLPSTLIGLLQARLDRVAEARKVAPIGAAIGRTFRHDLLVAVAELEEDELSSVLERLIDAGLILRQNAGSERIYSFKHALVQDAAYSGLLQSQRRQLHARIAEILLGRFPEVAANRPEVIARHLTQAHQAERAVDYWRKAAVVAVQNSAQSEAVSHLNAALEQNERTESVEARIKNEIALREMLFVSLEARSWGAPEIEENLTRLHDLVRKHGDRRQNFTVLNGFFSVYHIDGRLNKAKKLAHRMLRLAKKENNRTFYLLSERVCAVSHFFAGDFGEAIAHYDNLISHHGEDIKAELEKYYVGDQFLIAHYMSSWAYALLGKKRDCKKRLEKAVQLLDDGSRLFNRIYACCINASISQTNGDQHAALHHASAGLDLSKEHKNPYWESWARILMGWALAATGEHVRGIDMLGSGIEKYKTTGSRLILPYADALLADAYGHADAIVEGMQVVHRLEDADATNEVRFFDDQLKVISRRLRRLANS